MRVYPDQKLFDLLQIGFHVKVIMADSGRRKPGIVIAKYVPGQVINPAHMDLLGIYKGDSNYDLMREVNILKIIVQHKDSYSISPVIYPAKRVKIQIDIQETVKNKIGDLI